MEKELEANITLPPPAHHRHLHHDHPPPPNSTTITATSAGLRLSTDIEKAFQSSNSSSSSFFLSTDAPPDWHASPLNPHNWSLSKRIYHTLVPAIYGFTISFTSSVYTPGIPSLQHQFHLSSTTALLGLSLYTLGLAFGPMIAAPLSETYGRKVVYLVSMPVFVAFVVGGGASRGWDGVLAFRVLAGVFGSPVLAVAGGTAADLWATRERGIATSLLLLPPFAGPSLGPVIGGFAAQKGWRWTHWVILFFAVFSYLLALLSSETYKKIILLRHANRTGQTPPPRPTTSLLVRTNKFLTETLSRPLHMLLTEPIVFFFSLYVSFAFGVLFAFFAAFPLVFRRVYGFDGAQVGLTFVAIGIGCVLAVATAVVADLTVYQKLVRKDRDAGGEGVLKPEYRLHPAMVGSVGLPISLFWFAWTARPDIHWAIPVVAAIPFAWGNLCIFTSAVIYMIDTYSGPTAASALAANGMARYVFGAAFPLFTIPMYNRLGIAWATSLLGFLSLALLPVPWVLWTWGPRIRKKSGYETIDA